MIIVDKSLKLLFLITTTSVLSACTSISYYSQAIGGHLSLLSHREPIEEVIQDPDLAEGVRERLQLATEVIAFARNELALPDNGSYRHFVRVDGRYVVWNVIAAPHYSLQARHWCYPFAGCASYRGYYDKADAQAYADGLKDEGMDVAVSGASAYSTLGWFSDPLLSTMLYKDEGRFVEVIIHELAHQRLYIKDNTQLNEGFAQVVAREGVRRWFLGQGRAGEYESYLADERLDIRFNELLQTTRQRLEALYLSNLSEPEMAMRKQAIFSRLQRDYQAFKRRYEDDRYDRWMAQDLNNAHLSLVATYNQLIPQLQDLLATSEGDMELFYRRVEAYVQTLRSAS
ncbi:MAG: aminopeptidase [Gammaproteobacteria bacterium]|nr:aminopeptidase [Gammaproteobacteria bacterium]